jgi:carboxypeptidase D
MRGSRVLAVYSLLSLSAFIPATLADKTAADYFVHSLPGAPEGPLLKMHAGYVLERIGCASFSDFPLGT